MYLDEDLLERILFARNHKYSFQTLVNNFPEKLDEFDPVNNCIEIQSYFGEGYGSVSAKEKLLKDGIIENNWLYKYVTKKGKEKEDFKGIYIFLYHKIPFYVGISKGVIGRILQHVKGNNHFTSTLAYNIALLQYEKKFDKEYIGERKKFDFKNNVTPVKKFLLHQQIAFLPIFCDEELYLFEIYCAMKYGTMLNSFETH